MRGKRGSQSRAGILPAKNVGTGLPVRPNIRDNPRQNIGGNLRSRFFWKLYGWCQDSIYHLMPYRKLLWDTYQALDLKPGMKVLDAGCGTGNFELFTSEKDPPPIKIEAIDFSPVMLARAMNKCKDLDYVNFKLIDLNQKLPFPNHTFDSIVCLDTLQRLENPRFAFQELDRVLKPSGKLIMAESKPDAKTTPIAKEHLRRIKNVWGLSKKSINFLTAISRLPTLSLTSSLQNRFNSENGEEKELVPLFKKSEFRGVNISPSYADQSEFVHSVKNSSPEHQATNNYPLIFKVAETKEEIEGAQELRFRVFCEKKRYLDPTSYSLGIEEDEYDPYSVHFIALNQDGKAVGTNRLILNSEVGFHLEKYFDISNSSIIPQKGRVAEISRLSVESGEIEVGDPVAFGLYKISYDFSIEHGITHWFAILDEALYRYYKYIGYIFRPIGEPKNCLGGITTPYILCLSETMANLKQKNPFVFEFLDNPFGGIFNDELKRNNNYERSLRRISH